MTLGEFLRVTASQPFALGSCDCATWVADWIYARTGIDPASAVRDLYVTPRQRTRELAARGGFLAVVREGMTRAGMVLTSMPMPGDVALIRSQRHAHARELLFVLRGDARWYGKFGEGLAIVRDAECVTCWTFPPALAHG